MFEVATTYTTSVISVRITPYDLADSSPDAYPTLRANGRIVYLGQGTYHTVNGVAQVGQDVRHFWRWAEK